MTEKPLTIPELTEFIGACMKELLRRHAPPGTGYVLFTIVNTPHIGGSDIVMATNCDATTLITQLRWFADHIEAHGLPTPRSKP